MDTWGFITFLSLFLFMFDNCCNKSLNYVFKHEKEVANKTMRQHARQRNSLSKDEKENYRISREPQVTQEV